MTAYKCVRSFFIYDQCSCGCFLAAGILPFDNGLNRSNLLAAIATTATNDIDAIGFLCIALLIFFSGLFDGGA